MARSVCCEFGRHGLGNRSADDLPYHAIRPGGGRLGMERRVPLLAHFLCILPSGRLTPMAPMARLAQPRFAYLRRNARHTRVGRFSMETYGMGREPQFDIAGCSYRVVFPHLRTV